MCFHITMSRVIIRQTSHHVASIDIYHRGKAKKGTLDTKGRFVNRRGNILTFALCVTAHARARTFNGDDDDDDDDVGD